MAQDRGILTIAKNIVYGVWNPIMFTESGKAHVQLC